jgi:alkanesulfonate monooxygenase SsuD/methylene tetrahydromethanopterin reductase-like flavin-dependent oxidoreductase (luciferase family)
MEFGLTFGFQVMPESGTAWNEPYQDMLTCLPRAEELGYTSASVVSHHAKTDGTCPGLLIACAAAAAVTKTMRIGTTVLLVPLYAPLKLAEDIAVLDNVSQGRFTFGVAPGYMTEEFLAHGVPKEERVGRFEEALDLMTMAWTQERFEFNGKYYQVPETVMTPKPLQKPHPLIRYGVSATRSLQAAAKRRAVQIMSPRHGFAELKAHYEIYDAAVKAEGWVPPERPLMRCLFVAPTKEQAEALAAPALNHLFREIYGRASADGDRALHTDDGTVVTDFSQVDFSIIKDRFIIGDPDYAVEMLQRYRDAFDPTELNCFMHMAGISGADAMKSVELFAKEVMPHFV